MEKHDRIFEAALDLFSQYGLQKVNVQEIADAAGVSKKTLYNHFDGKEDIFFLTIQWHVKGLIEFYEELLANEELSLGEKLIQAINQGAREFSFKHSKMYPDMGRHNPYLQEKPLNYIRTHIKKAIGGLIDQSKSEGICRTDYSTEKLVYVILTLMNGLLSWDDTDEREMQTPDLFHASITLILDSLLTEKGRAMLPVEELTHHGLEL